MPISNVKELISYSKANPGKLNYGSTGQGGITHLGTEMLKLMAGIDITHIPYKGTGPALTEIIGGQIQFLLGSIVSTLPHTRTGKLRAFAVTTLQRSSAVPELPTIDESGLQGYELTQWFGLWAPARTPKAVLLKLNGEVRRVLLLPEVRDRLAREGLEPRHSTPEQFEATISTDIDKFKKVVRDARIKVE